MSVTMEKKMEDYLHLYIGCDVQINTGDAVFAAKLIGVFYDVWPSFGTEKLLSVQVKTENEDRFFEYAVGPHCVRLVLRPLSDMTEEENEIVSSLYAKNN